MVKFLNMNRTMNALVFAGNPQETFKSLPAGFERDYSCARDVLFSVIPETVYGYHGSFPSYTAMGREEWDAHAPPEAADCNDGFAFSSPRGWSPEQVRLSGHAIVNAAEAYRKKIDDRAPINSPKLTLWLPRFFLPRGFVRIDEQA